MQLEVSDELHERVVANALAEGLTVEAYLAQLVRGREEAARERRRRAADHIRELRKGITLGPDLTIQDLIEEGRRS